MFRGKHNRSKSLCLLTLARYSGGLTLKELANLSPVLYSTLRAHLGNWHKWKYVTRRVTSNGGRPVFRYGLAERGRHFIIDIIPAERLEDYKAELKEYNQKRAEERRIKIQELIHTMPSVKK